MFKLVYQAHGHTYDEVHSFNSCPDKAVLQDAVYNYGVGPFGAGKFMLRHAGNTLYRGHATQSEIFVEETV